MSALPKTETENIVGNFLSRNDPYNIDALDMPVQLARSSEWDIMDPTHRARVLGGMLRNVVKRTVEHVPLYRDDVRWQQVNPDDITDISDLRQLPVISKDPVPGTGTPSTSGIQGFRERAIEDPYVLVPTNLTEVIARQESANPGYNSIRSAYGDTVLSFGSGGSKGRSTQTFLSYLTIEAEAQALARALFMNGFRRGQSIACMYAPDHKGGLQLKRAADIMDMNFHSKRDIFESLSIDPRFQDAAEGFKSASAGGDLAEQVKYATIVREGIREYIRAHGIQVIESVQPPDEFMAKNAKGSGLAFMEIYREDPKAFEGVDHVFLTGFTVPASAYDRLRQDGINVSTTWGSTEAMALGTYSGHTGSSDVNQLEAIPFPTVGQIVHYRERGLPKPTLEEAVIGEEGHLIVTSLLGGGSTYINYAIGDRTERIEGGYGGTHRTSSTSIAGSCAADALSL